MIKIFAAMSGTRATMRILLIKLISLAFTPSGSCLEPPKPTSCAIAERPIEILDRNLSSESMAIALRSRTEM